MPLIWDEFATDQLAYALAESRGQAENLMGMAQALQTHLPGTMAALLDGTISWHKAGLIANATQFLDPAECRAAEAKVLDRAGRLTPGGLRAAIARAVMETAPDKTRKRREAATKDARVERWAEDSGNAALMGRELLCPARTQEPQETRRPRPAAGRDRVRLHPGQPGRAARRIRHVDPANSRRRAGPAGHPGPARHLGLRPPVRKPGP